jgi:hypothetical protein
MRGKINRGTGKIRIPSKAPPPGLVLCCSARSVPPHTNNTFYSVLTFNALLNIFETFATSTRAAILFCNGSTDLHLLPSGMTSFPRRRQQWFNMSTCRTSQGAYAGNDLAAMGGATMEHETRAGYGPHVTGSLGNPPKQGGAALAFWLSVLLVWGTLLWEGRCPRIGAFRTKQALC